FGLERVELRALALDLLLVAVGRDQRELARQQIVARVAVGDLHHFAAAAQVVHVLSQNHFHDRPSKRLNAELVPRSAGSCVAPAYGTVPVDSGPMEFATKTRRHEILSWFRAFVTSWLTPERS